ncbi:unnamed protein product [Gadus morhua 'NCC']
MGEICEGQMLVRCGVQVGVESVGWGWGLPRILSSSRGKLIHGENFLFHAQNHAIPFGFLARPRPLALPHVLRVPSLASTGRQGRIGSR